MVLNSAGMQMGYVTAERAPMVSRWLAEGRGVDAIFQKPAAYGAVIRVGLDGEVPALPIEAEAIVDDTRAPSDDSDFWPDDEWSE